MKLGRGRHNILVPSNLQKISTRITGLKTLHLIGHLKAEIRFIWQQFHESLIMNIPTKLLRSS